MLKIRYNIYRGLKMAKYWCRLIDYTFGVRMAVVQDNLVDDFEYDLTSKHPDAVFVCEPLETSSYFMDLAGPIWSERHVESIDVDGLKLEIPSQDYESILFGFKLATPKTLSNGIQYYQLNNPSGPNCLVLTSEQRNHVIQVMEENLEAAKEQGNRDDLEFCERIKKLNEMMGYRVLESSRANAIDAASQGKKGSN